MMKILSETLMISFSSSFNYKEDVDDGVGELQEFDILFADKEEEEEVQVETKVEEDLRNPDLNLRRSLTTPFPSSVTLAAKTSGGSSGDCGGCGGGDEVVTATKEEAKPIPIPDSNAVKQLKEEGMILEIFGAEVLTRPHVMVAMRDAATRCVAHSMLEGIGRTLKGRDMINFRDTVLRLNGLIEN